MASPMVWRYNALRARLTKPELILRNFGSAAFMNNIRLTKPIGAKAPVLQGWRNNIVLRVAAAITNDKHIVMRRLHRAAL